MTARIDAFLRTMVEQQGSDLHLTVGQPPKIRVHGNLEPLPEPPIAAEEMLALLKECCLPEKWAWFLENKDLDFAYEVEGVARFRVNYLFNQFGAGAVLRQIPTRILTIEELGLPTVLREVCGYGRGLVLVTGPTGSGKSTTLAAMIDFINSTQTKHIITIEDPIEFVHQNKLSVLEQREVGADCRSFGEALRHAMRADPDIVLVGEMRDLETISLALACAATGMLVFATLHTNNAPKTVDRIIDSFPAEEQPQARAVLSQNLVAVISQLLCRKKDGKGRVAAIELLLNHPALPATIREGAISNIVSIIEQSSAMGMKTMDSDLMRFVRTGIITPLEAYRKASVKKEFEHLLTPADLEML